MKYFLVWEKDLKVLPDKTKETNQEPASGFLIAHFKR